MCFKFWRRYMCFTAGNDMGRFCGWALTNREDSSQFRPFVFSWEGVAILYAVAIFHPSPLTPGGHDFLPLPRSEERSDDLEMIIPFGEIGKWNYGRVGGKILNLWHENGGVWNQFVLANKSIHFFREHLTAPFQQYEESSLWIGCFCPAP